MRYAISAHKPDVIRAAREAGFDLVEAPVWDLIRPSEPQSAFEDAVARYRDLGLPVESLNLFLAGELRCVGPDANHDDIADYAQTVFSRMAAAGIPIMVFGSGWTRKIPDGWTKAQADEQFAALLARLGPLAEANGVTLVVEPLARVECNYLNTVDEGAALARASGSPAVGVLADSFHWARNGEPVGTILGAKDRFRHAHVATVPNRLVPGAEPYDWAPFFGALATIGYDGRVTVEARLPDDPAGLVELFRTGLETLRAAVAAARA